MKKGLIFLFLFLIIAGLSFSFASAQEFTAKAPGWQGIVPCGRNSGANGETTQCTLCHLVLGIQRIIQYGLYIVIACAFAGIFIAGVMYVISSGNEGMITQAKGFLSASLIGFAVVLGAWIIVNTTLWIIGSNKYDSGNGLVAETWWRFSCSTTNAPRITAATPTQDNPNALNDRKKCLLYCARNYQVETDPFKGCWKLQCPKVDFGSFTPDDACLLECYRNYSGSSGDMYNCLKLKCPNGSYINDYKPENFATTQCGLNNRGKCYPREGPSAAFGSCPVGFTWLASGSSCPNGYRCCEKDSTQGAVCGADGAGICKSKSESCSQIGASEKYPQCGSGLKCCKK